VVDLEAVDGWHNRCCDSMNWVGNSKPWESDKVTLTLNLLWRTGWWRSIGREVWQMLKAHSGVNAKLGE